MHDGYLADPFVLRTDDGYVAFGTGRTVDGRAFEVLRSDDLVHWRSVGGALEQVPGLGTDYWAPEVAHAEGRWWMYYSAGTGDVGHQVRVAVADDPVGPYRDTGHVLTEGSASPSTRTPSATPTATGGCSSPATCSTPSGSAPCSPSPGSTA
ncbi:hypothetical protein GCM10025868_11680 [Angustibacter aerolatus]|uniref:Glycosyl hydrolase family 43 n=1 Tax=Angustibacter aerolatus TaxID=1162965 RepID=A0ABQ6JCM6_9ACTN|nr:family 43 glycosylhydrolase [Angustibacter aerolatus]GMA85918.1 hypothetical protein GCM10025868_11680 [Angustibacter aerolatus]